MKRNRWKKIAKLGLVLAAAASMLAGCGGIAENTGEVSSRYRENTGSGTGDEIEVRDGSEIPGYDGEPYIVLDGNEPSFTESEITEDSFESYSELDELGRCGAACASVGQEIMPTEERGRIGQVRPTGWHTVKYDFVDGKYLYNRCHLLGYQLTGENANEKNLITGTRYLNVDGMLPFENMIADYVKETENHVMYRVTPVYEGDDLVASGVEMEGYSVEDEGEGICFHVFCYNVQPNVEIDYSTGESRLAEDTSGLEPEKDGAAAEYILNTNTRKFHRPECSGVKAMKESNKETFTGSREELIEMGYEACGQCKP